MHMPNGSQYQWNRKISDDLIENLCIEEGYDIDIVSPGPIIFTTLPPGVAGMITNTLDEVVIYVDESLSAEEKVVTIIHEMLHYIMNDYTSF